MVRYFCENTVSSPWMHWTLTQLRFPQIEAFTTNPGTSNVPGSITGHRSARGSSHRQNLSRKRVREEHFDVSQGRKRVAKQSGVKIEQQFTQEILSNRAQLFCSCAISRLSTHLRAAKLTDSSVGTVFFFHRRLHGTIAKMDECKYCVA